MKCERCNATISGNKKECPLCNHVLVTDGPNIDSVFPIVKLRSKREKFIFNLVSLVLFSGSVICFLINLVITGTVFWSLFVIAGAVCLWISLFLALRARRHIPKAVFWQVMLVAVLAVLWDFATDFRGWSITFVIPIIFIGAIVIIRLVSRILKLSMYDYIIYLIANGVLGIIPLIFILTGVLITPIPSVICVAISAISLAVLFIFDKKSMIDEIQRRTHIK